MNKNVPIRAIGHLYLHYCERNCNGRDIISRSVTEVTYTHHPWGMVHHMSVFVLFSRWCRCNSRTPALERDIPPTTGKYAVTHTQPRDMYQPRYPLLGHKPTIHQPTSHQPTCHQPTSHQPTRHQPARHQPTSHKPTSHQTTRHQPTRHQPARHQPTSHQPTRHQPTRHQPARQSNKIGHRAVATIFTRLIIIITNIIIN